jgi:Insertion element 4 transposase N-terminal/Transposase DDE domain
MPRSGWVKPVSDRRLSDLVSVGVLTRTFPPDLVDEVIAGCGRTEVRHRSLPARTMAYFAIGMALHSEGSYEDVMSLLTDGLAWATSAEPLKLPSKSGIFQARERLGFEPIEALFAQVARPLAPAAMPGAWLAGRRLVAIDGTSLDVADTPENTEHFGRPGVSKGEQAAFPQARVVALIECGTHAIFDAVVGACTTGEVTLSRSLVGRLRPGMLCLADRGFYGFNLWEQAKNTGADLLWRMRASQRLDPIEVLADGSYLSKVFEVRNFKRRGHGIVVRVIDYTIDDGRQNDNVYQLITTILDPGEASAEELALAYAQRWEIETTFDELKSHQRGPRAVLRSKSPSLVLQEIWGHLCCHYAIRTLMFEAAHDASVDPDRVSFVAALRIARRSISAARDFSPSDH